MPCIPSDGAQLGNRLKEQFTRNANCSSLCVSRLLSERKHFASRWLVPFAAACGERVELSTDFRSWLASKVTGFRRLGLCWPAVTGGEVYLMDYVHKSGEATNHAGTRDKLCETEQTPCKSVRE